MASNNILFLPFRRTSSVQFSAAIRQYITTSYEQRAEEFIQDMEAIDKLRSEAVNTLEAHVSGIRKLTVYAAQLVYMGGKFPIDMGVDFTWYTALGFNTQRPLSQNNIRFELANVLFNLASLYSQLAVSLNRTTSEGLKNACNYFCQAAGVINHLQTEVLPEMRGTIPEDMDTMTLKSIQQLLLAQAQECFWSKAVKDGLKDGLIAKLAAKVSDFYDQAAECGTRSDTINTEWIHHMTAKHHHFAAAAQYRASRECLEKQEYGEEVARLRDSLTCVNEALKESRWINKIVLGDLNGLKSRVMEDLKRAEKDNDIIYLMPVPPKSELSTLGRAGMATPRCPEEVTNPLSSLGDRGVLGQPLFARLVPYAVHIAASIYEERKNRLVKVSIIDELEGLNSQLQDLLHSLNLPGSLQALEKPLGLPTSLTSHAEEVRQQDGLHKLRRAMRETATLRDNDGNIFKDAVEFLRSEAAEEDRARLKHGTERWTRPPSKRAGERLYGQVNEIDGYLKSAASSDELIKSKLKDCEKPLQVLSGSARDLEEYVPSSRKATMPPNVERVAYDLRNTLDEASRLESRRKKQIDKIRDKAKSDNINHVILAETARLEREFPMQNIEPAQFENLFEDRLTRYDEDISSIKFEKESQNTLTSQIKTTNAAFTTARKGDTSTHSREQALQRLENAYVKYKEVSGNIDSGRQFYNQLAGVVTRFRDECKDFAYSRRQEAGALESELADAMSTLSLSQTNHLQDQKQREGLRSHYSAKAPKEEPMPAPVPTRANVQPPPAPSPALWSPEMGINFGGPAKAPPLPPAGANVHKPEYPNTRARGAPGQWDGKGVRFG